MRWVIAVLCLIGIAWYVGRLRRMHALRGHHHLTDLAAGLREMQERVRSEYGQPASPTGADSKSPPPAYTTASGGALIAWSAEPAPEGGAVHRVTLLSYYETWWINGYLILFICDRLGLDLDAIRITRTDRGTTHLFATLSEKEHRALMARQIEDPPAQGFSRYRDELASELARHAPPPVVDSRSLTPG